MKVLVSACLLGECFKYDGGSNRNGAVIAFLAGNEAVPVCPEVLGGLPTPRVPSEIVDGQVVAEDGRNVDAQFRAGAAEALRTALEEGVQLAVLQPRSPSCGVHEVYDGTFSGRIVAGRGVFAQMLVESGIPVVDSADVERLSRAEPPDAGASAGCAS